MLQETLQNKLQRDIHENELKIQKTGEELTKKINDISKELQTVEKKLDADKSRNTIDSNTVDVKLKEVKTDINKTTESLIAKSKEECLSKVSSCCNDFKTLEKKLDSLAPNKNAPDSKEINEKLKQAQEEMKKNVDLLLSKCKEELNVKVTLTETKVQKIKEDLLSKSTNNASETKSLGMDGFCSVIYEKKMEVVRLFHFF
jgi:alanyl-tRNA synthetase